MRKSANGLRFTRVHLLKASLECLLAISLSMNDDTGFQAQKLREPPTGEYRANP
jgi:hypothetical protein